MLILAPVIPHYGGEIVEIRNDIKRVCTLEYILNINFSIFSVLSMAIGVMGIHGMLFPGNPRAMFLFRIPICVIFVYDQFRLQGFMRFRLTLTVH